MVTKVTEGIKSGLSTDQIYTGLIRDEARTVSETLANPKFIDNRKYLLKMDKNLQSSTASEAETLIHQVKDTKCMLNTVVFSPVDYVAMNYVPAMIDNLRKFCVAGDSILRVDTTFELVDGPSAHRLYIYKRSSD